LQTASLTLARTDPGHASMSGGSSAFAEDKNRHYEIRPRGTSVSHEEEMLKLAGNQLDYDAVTSLYTHSLALIKTAIGRA
jgi:flagellar basal-body rod protein FlgB